MVTKVIQKEKEEKISIPHLINDFLFKNRRIILVILAVLVAALIVIITYVVIVEKKNTAAITKIEDIIESWDEARLDNKSAALEIGRASCRERV